MSTTNMIAAVGTDGTRPVVWGVGRNEAEALADAGAQDGLDGVDLSTLDLQPITEAQAAKVRTGDVSWPVTA